MLDQSSCVSGRIGARLSGLRSVVFLVLTASVLLVHALLLFKNAPWWLIPRGGTGLFDLMMSGSRGWLEPFREVSDYSFRCYRDRLLVVPASRRPEYQVWGCLCGFIVLPEEYDDSITKDEASALLKRPHRRIEPASGEMSFVFVEGNSPSVRLRVLTHGNTKFVVPDEADHPEGVLP